MAGRHSQGSHSAPHDFTDEFVEEQPSEETVYETRRLFGRKKAQETYEDSYDDSYEEEYDEEYEEEYEEDWEEEEEEKPRFGFLRGFGRKKKEEEAYDDEYDEYEEEYDEYEEEEEEAKPRFNPFASFGRKKDREDSRASEAEVTYGDNYDEEYDEDDSVSLERILTVALGVLMVVALAAAVFAVVTLLGSGKSDKAGEEPAATYAEETVAVETMAPSAAEMQASGQLAEATPEPTGSKAVLTADGILVPGERGPVVPERDSIKPLEEFATVTMIGNSFVEGMKLWSDINCEYVCADGVSLDNMIGNHLYFVTVRDYDAIYLTLGLNEIGWPVDSFITKYEKVIDYIRSDAYSKTATIYITSVMPVEQLMETQKAESGQTIKLSTIQTFNEALKEMCQRKGCWYLDVYSALADESGYLPADIAADDHVHFEKTGYRIWTEYLQSHYVDESLLEG